MKRLTVALLGLLCVAALLSSAVAESRHRALRRAHKKASTHHRAARATVHSRHSKAHAPNINIEQREGAANTTIVVHVVNDNDGRVPAEPPHPPAIPAARLGVGLPGGSYPNPRCSGDLITCAAAALPGAAQPAAALPYGGNVGAISGVPSMAVIPAASLAMPVAGAQMPNLQPQPLSVTTPAADLLPSAQVTPLTNAGSPTESVGTYAVQTVPGVRILGEEDRNPKDCQCTGDPCKCRFSPTDQIEAALDRVKTAIVVQAQKVQQENRWIRAVKKIIKHYEEKIGKVQTHVGHMKEDIKKLFSKKKHYEDLLLQHQLDADAFKKAMKERKWKKERAAEKKEAKLDRDCERKRRGEDDC